MFLVRVNQKQIRKNWKWWVEIYSYSTREKCKRCPCDGCINISCACAADEKWSVLPVATYKSLKKEITAVNCMFALYIHKAGSSLTSPLLSLLPFFPQIMIEFCPGGAVDATMLGRPLSLCLFCSLYFYKPPLPITRVKSHTCGSALTTHVPSAVTSRKCTDMKKGQRCYWFHGMFLFCRKKQESQHSSQYCRFAPNMIMYCNFSGLAF